MKTGMLWFDNDKARDLEAKIARAAAYFQRKHGAAATVCFVHPAALPAGEVVTAGLAVKPSKGIPPDHFWLGVAPAP